MIETKEIDLVKSNVGHQEQHMYETRIKQYYNTTGNIETVAKKGGRILS